MVHLRSLLRPSSERVQQHPRDDLDALLAGLGRKRWTELLPVEW
jgi:hypothetical protein